MPACKPPSAGYAGLPTNPFPAKLVFFWRNNDLHRGFIQKGSSLHIQDGLLDVTTCVGTAVLSATALGLAVRRVGQAVALRNAPLMGVVASCLFAAQMINFPIPGGTSGHLLGGVLAAVMLGPWSALIVLTVVLAVQCLLMSDGGITTLGANVLNVGVIGCVVGYAIFEPIRRLVGGQRGTVVGAVLAAWFSVVIGATACSIELGLSGTYVLPPTLGVMLLTHSIIGLGESLFTGFAVAFVLRTRPDLVYMGTSDRTVLAQTGQVLLGGLAIALLLAILLSPFASSLPDGLEKSLERLGIDTHRAEPLLPSPMPDYVPRGLENVRWAGSIAGGIGTIVAFAVAYLISRGLSSRPTSPHTPHAS
jgi:cobalt/nickel transport system permease protein